MLIGCDGVNSMVAKWMGLPKPIDANRSAIRGYVEYPKAHGFEPKFCAYFGGGVRIGFLPCDHKSLYWFCTFTPSDVDCKSSFSYIYISTISEYVSSRIQYMFIYLSDLCDTDEIWSVKTYVSSRVQYMSIFLSNLSDTNEI